MGWWPGLLEWLTVKMAAEKRLICGLASMNLLLFSSAGTEETKDREYGQDSLGDRR